MAKINQPQTLDEKVDAILRILQGEPLDPKDDGLLGTVRYLKAEIRKLIDWKKGVIAWTVGFSFGAGILVSVAFKVVFK